LVVNPASLEFELEAKWLSPLWLMETVVVARIPFVDDRDSNEFRPLRLFSTIVQFATALLKQAS
jgi:hypothetical protein